MNSGMPVSIAAVGVTMLLGERL